MIRAFLRWLLCERHDIHDTGRKRYGPCRRCPAVLSPNQETS